MTAVAAKISEIAQLRGYLEGDDLVEAAQLLAEASPIWVPLPGPQTDAYYCNADILYYGGAAGGGKRDVGACSCKPTPRGLPSSLVQPRGTQHIECWNFSRV